MSVATRAQRPFISPAPVRIKIPEFANALVRMLAAGSCGAVLLKIWRELDSQISATDLPNLCPIYTLDIEGLQAKTAESGPPQEMKHYESGFCRLSHF
jgi:hypothetical protein